jgi:hypothetical protein
LIAKERELLRFHSELIAKENELQKWKEKLLAENQILESRQRDLDDREMKINLLEKDLSETFGMLIFLMVDPYTLGSKSSSFSPSHLRKIINAKSYSLLNRNITH